MERRAPHQQDRAQSLVEFALVLPLLVLIVVGLFDLGYAVFLNNTVSNAAREGARVGIIIANSDEAIRSRVKTTAAGLGISDDQITIQPTPSRTFDTPVRVTVVYTYTPMTPLIGRVVGEGAGVRLSATSVMIVEGVLEP